MNCYVVSDRLSNDIRIVSNLYLIDLRFLNLDLIDVDSMSFMIIAFN